MRSNRCCTDVAETPRSNAAGRTTLRYRIGTWSSFRDRMLRRIPLQPGDTDADPATAERPLARLTTRAPSDPTISLIDAWACVCDVLTFYGERIVNEGYLATSTEPRSVTEIARSIGYRPDPGLSATTPLAFTIDPTVEGEVVVPIGQPVLSVPGPNELPQTFELLFELLARSAWNTVRPRRTVEHPIAQQTDQLYLSGVNTRLSVGDPIVVIGSERTAEPDDDVTEHWDLRFVTAVQTFMPADTYANEAHTVITLDRGLGTDLTSPAAVDIRVLTMGNRAGLFGGTAPDARMMSVEIKANAELMSHTQWRNFAMANDTTRTQLGGHVIDLDQEYPGIVRGSWVCLQGPSQVELFKVKRVTPAGRAEFSLTSRVTRLFLDADEHIDDFNRRSTTVLCESREIPIAERPDTSPVSGFAVELDAWCPPMPVGRPVLVRGELVDTGESVIVHTSVVAWTDGSRSTLTVATSLPAMHRHTVEIFGNVATASHGAKVPAEVLGHGDASRPNQRMLLRHAPLTWVPASPTGSTATLAIRVGGVEWQQVPTFYGTGPNDHVFTIERVVTDDTGTGADQTIVSFGDGTRGARLPTGFDNVVASYRFGLGAEGNLAPGQLTLLQERPAAVRAVTNPMAPTGGAPPAHLDEIRRLAPLGALTLGRLVAVQDYEDHAGTFPGVGKARATELWDGHRSFIHITAAAANGEALTDLDPAAISLIESMGALKDPGHRVVVWGHEPVAVAVGMRLRVVSGALFSAVRDDLVAALVEAFGFTARQFGQPLLSAEVAAVAHRNPLVHAVDIDTLHRVGDAVALLDVVPAATAAWDGSTIRKAELLELHADTITISPLDVT